MYICKCLLQDNVERPRYKRFGESEPQHQNPFVFIFEECCHVQQKIVQMLIKTLNESKRTQSSYINEEMIFLTDIIVNVSNVLA